MTYSSAVYATPEQSLADAQRNKYRIHAQRAGIEPGSHVLEIGSGWGGFAIFAAGELGCDVTSITVSPAQHQLATERIAAAGLAHRARVELRDYRRLQGEFDAIVSIEMLEAVGAEYFEAFFAACDRALKPGGKMSLQSICFPDVAYEPQRRGANWIQQYIFPGGLLPSLAAIEGALHGTRLIITETHDIPTVTSARSRRGANASSSTSARLRARLRRALHPHVGLLPGPVAGRLRNRAGPGPADRAREATRAGRLINGLAGDGRPPTGLWLDPRRSWPGMPKG